MSRIIYLLVADRGGAKIFSSDEKLEDLQPLFDEVHEAGRKTDSEWLTDRPGRLRDSKGNIHGLGHERSAEESDAKSFAAHISGLLRKDYQDGRFQELMIAAPPRFLGHLRDALDAGCMAVLSRSLHKDLVRASMADILAHFRAA